MTPTERALLRDCDIELDKWRQQQIPDSWPLSPHSHIAALQQRIKKALEKKPRHTRGKP